MPSAPKIALVIPAYNEAPTIQEVMTRCHHACPEAALYVVDNNSSDSTAILAAQTLRQLNCPGAILKESLQGKGNALRRAFLSINADIYATLDADLTYSATELRKLLNPVVTGEYDMVIGDRHSSGDYRKVNTRAFHDFGNNLVKRLINLLFRSKLRDIMTGYRVFNRFFIKNFPITSSGFEIETEMTLHALDKRFRILEIPVSYVARPEGSVSKLSTYKDGIRVIITIFNIFRNYKPFAFFGGLSLVALLSGLGIGLPVFIEFYQTHYIRKVPTAILASGVMIIAALLFAIALILDTVEAQNSANYELWLLRENSEAQA